MNDPAVRHSAADRHDSTSGNGPAYKPEAQARVGRTLACASGLYHLCGESQECYPNHSYSLGHACRAARDLAIPRDRFLGPLPSTGQILMTGKNTRHRVAVVQAASVLFDRERSSEKAAALIRQAPSE